MMPLLAELSKVPDVRDCIPKFVRNNTIDFRVAIQICKQAQIQLE